MFVKILKNNLLYDKMSQIEKNPKNKKLNI